MAIITKQLKDLTYGDKIFHLRKKEILTVSDIMNDLDEDELKPGHFGKKYFYFKEIGSAIRDKGIRKMFETDIHSDIVIYN